MLEVIRVNVRVPEQVFGDLMANIACNEVGARQLLNFMDEYGLDDLAPLSAAIRGQSERAIRDRIAAIPDGVHKGTLDIEGIDDALRLACRAEVAGSGIALDFSGTSPPVHRGINVPFCYTRAMACYAVKCLTVPGMPNNEGAVAPIRVSAPEDSILNAQPPYPTGGRHVTGHMVVPLVFRTLADAVPGQVQADCGMMNIVTSRGTNPGEQPMSTVAVDGRRYRGDCSTPGIPCRKEPRQIQVARSRHRQSALSGHSDENSVAAMEGGTPSRSCAA